MEMGPKTLVIKRGEYGAMLFHGDSHFMVPGYCLKRFSIPPAPATASRADSSATWPSKGSISSGNVSAKELSRAVIYGSVMGSFCCEKFGVERFEH